MKYFLVDPQKEHEDQMYALNKLSELLKKMLLNDKSAQEPACQSTSDFQREFECPICFEEMRPPTRIWQCVDGHAICEACRNRLDTCPSCSRAIEGRNIALEKMARSLYGENQK